MTDTAESPMTVRAVIALYLRHSAAQGTHGPEARADRERTLGLFVAMHGDLPVANARQFHLTDFIEAHPSWKSLGTKRAKANMVRAAFEWAADQERIDKNPFRKVRYLEAPPRPPMPDDSLDWVSRFAHKQYEEAVSFLRLTGCRLSEMCNAVWADLDLERGVWLIPRHKGRKRSGKPKLVALVVGAVELLEAIRTRAAGPQQRDPEPSARVFLNTRGRPWTRRTMGQHLRRLKDRHGIDTPATLHGIRHQFATEAVASGAPLKLVAAQLGHSAVSITERYYVHLQGEVDAVRAAAELAQRKSPQQK